MGKEVMDLDACMEKTKAKGTLDRREDSMEKSDNGLVKTSQDYFVSLLQLYYQLRILRVRPRLVDVVRYRIWEMSFDALFSMPTTIDSYGNSGTEVLETAYSCRLSRADLSLISKSGMRLFEAASSESNDLSSSHETMIGLRLNSRRVQALDALCRRYCNVICC